MELFMQLAFPKEVRDKLCIPINWHMHL